MKSHAHPWGVPSLREWVETGKLYGGHCDGEEHGCGHTEPPFCARSHIWQRNIPPSRCPHFSWHDDMNMSWGTQPVASELRTECGQTVSAVCGRGGRVGVGCRAPGHLPYRAGIWLDLESRIWSAGERSGLSSWRRGWWNTWESCVLSRSESCPSFLFPL